MSIRCTVQTLTQVLDQRAELQAQDIAFTYLHDGERDAENLTFGELRERALLVAARLSVICEPGQRALLLYPSGMEFIVAFFGSLYAGVVAVPAYPPRRNRRDQRLRAIAADARPSVVLTNSELLRRLSDEQSAIPELAPLQWLSTDDLGESPAATWARPAVRGDNVAFLQYTSGSTGKPKGVIVSHHNLVHNERLVEVAFEHSPRTRFVGWLPLFHDMGLIGNVLQPLYLGVPCVLMSPNAFLQKPLRWLQAISSYRGTTSGGPNFAYDLCVQSTTPEQRAGLDLSCWEVAFNGAEPVRADTLERFARAFEPSGFRREAFYPCYGMAEASLFVAGGKPGVAPIVRTFERGELKTHQAVEPSQPSTAGSTLVGCGRTWLDLEVAIADPESLIPCPEGRVGEIWVAGPSVAQGYWNAPEATLQTFAARFRDSEAGPYLRTGDLGFLWEGELYVTGRVKDVIIIRGQNHYPQDIELTAERSHAALRPGCCAAFSMASGGEERLVVTCEVKKAYRFKLDVAEVVASIRQSVVDNHELQPADIVLLKPGGIPKTSSGKIQRHACRAAYLAGELKALESPATASKDGLPPACNPLADAKIVAPAEVPEPTSEAPITIDALKGWLVEAIARRCRIAAQEIDARAPFARYGLDSLGAVALSGELATLLGREVSPALAYDYPSIEALASHLAGPEPAPRGHIAGLSPGPDHSEPIAIVGLACRFPGADNADEFWNLLQRGQSAISALPAGRTEHSACGGHDYGLGGFLDQVDGFDPHLFGISPREAAAMDPQQRLLLEVVWEALESAGQVPGGLAGSDTGVFVGISTHDYARLQLGDPEARSGYSSTGTAASIAANRVSYLLDLRGPSLAIDTACSSSLVAVHQACRSLREGECDLAIAGGVNLILSPEVTQVLSQAQMMAADGRCKTFDAGADGYVRGEGCGAVVLKRLSAARRDGDTLLCLIRGSAVNQDGRSNGLTAPNGPAQQAVVRRALQSAGANPNQIGYVETHGTGTPLGDPIEVNALTETLAEGRGPDRPLVIGSVKTNIGHLEAAAGIAGLIKVALALIHDTIPPHLHLRTLNPHIQTAEGLLEIPTRPQDWPRGERPRLAGVSSFGFGGTNAHVVVEEAPAHQSAEPVMERSTHLLALSAQSEAALGALVASHLAHLRSTTPSLGDHCFSTNTGRTHFQHRIAIAAASSQELESRLARCREGTGSRGVFAGPASTAHKPTVAFLYPGQGCLYPGMGRHLYQTQPVFRGVLERCDLLFRPMLDVSLLELIHPKQGAECWLDETAYTQPALFAFQCALTAMWRSFGVEPDIVLGHSIGELAAACAAGAFSVEDGLALVATRGRLMQSLPKDGVMMVAFADQPTVDGAIAAHSSELAIAALNGPCNTVISGRREAVQTVDAMLREQGIVTRPLAVSHAFHSPLLDPILGPLEQAATGLRFQPLTKPLVSTLSGAVLEPGTLLDASYWRRHASEPVQYQTALRQLRSLGHTLYVEIGPKSVLQTLGADEGGSSESPPLWLSSMRQHNDNWPVVLESLAQLYVRGQDIDWRGVDAGFERSRCAVPSYPFQRKRYWFRDPSRKAPGAIPEPAPEAPIATTESATTVQILVQRQLRLMKEQLDLVQETAANATSEASPVHSGGSSLDAASTQSALPPSARDAEVIEVGAAD